MKIRHVFLNGIMAVLLFAVVSGCNAAGHGPNKKNAGTSIGQAESTKEQEIVSPEQSVCTEQSVSTGQAESAEELTATEKKSPETSSEKQKSEAYQAYLNHLQAVQKKSDQLEQEISEGNLSQQEMNQKSYELYELWDDELNALWKQLKGTLDITEMNQLTKEEKQWIQKKEEEVEKAGAEFEGGSMQPLVENGTAQKLTRERVYELAEYLK